MIFIKQRDSYGCGPISIFNALLWSGKRVNLKKTI